MNVRNWLGRARSIEKEINSLVRAKGEARDRIIRITQDYSTDVVGGTKDPHKTEHKIERVLEFEELIDQKIGDLYAVKAEITEAINTIEDGRQRTVLNDFYVRCVSLEQSAVEMHYSYANVKKIRARAIRALEKNIADGKFIPNYPSRCDII